MARPPKSKSHPPLETAFQSLRGAFVGVGVVSLVINLLMLTGPLFMLQVYDRVLASGSIPTLVVIGGLALSLYLFLGLLEGARGRILSRMGQQVDARLSGLAYGLSTAAPARFGPKANQIRPVRDLDTARQFLSSPGPAALYDIPWMPLYMGLVFAFHWMLGVVALVGAVIISILVVTNELLSRRPAQEAAEAAAQRSQRVETGRRNAEAVSAMGMGPALTARWNAGNHAYLTVQGRAADRAGFFGTLIKTIRMLLQSLVLATGAWLVIHQEASGGVMIASSILTSRALSPVEQAVAHWRSFVACRQALKRLKDTLKAPARTPARTGGMVLPKPEKEIRLESVSCGPMGVPKAVVRGVTLTLTAGEGLGIIGPSGSGKSTLSRALVGVAPVLGGSLRLDGAEYAQWDEARIGSFVGYLPQDPQLFEGTVMENIARFSPDATSEAVIEAARLADVHDLIVGLPQGYETHLGSDGYALSAGQRQRIGLARALHGAPFLVVLDEPNAHLDETGELALTAAMRAMREKGSIVVVVAHRPSAIAAVDTLLCLKDGQVVAQGPKDEVMKKITRPPPPITAETKAAANGMPPQAVAKIRMADAAPKTRMPEAAQ